MLTVVIVEKMGALKVSDSMLKGIITPSRIKANGDNL
jgi:hypothetical protein